MPAERPFSPGAVFGRVIEILESLGLRYAVGGSIASSIRSVERATQDMDVVVELPEAKVAETVRAFSSEFYISEAAVRDAVAKHRSFNVIHLLRGIKADLFVAGGHPLDEPQLAHATREVIDRGSGKMALVCSAEDIVLVKLDWYRRGRMVSDRQWEDVKNVIKLNQGIDLAYMKRVAEIAGLTQLLERALGESGK